MATERKTDGAASDQAFDADGVDLTLIRWMLSLSPRQRLEVLQRHVNSVLRLRESVRSRS